MPTFLIRTSQFNIH